MSGGLAIRPLAEADLDQLLLIYRHLVPDDADMPAALARQRFDALLSHPGLTVFGGFAGTRLASSVTLVVIPNLTRGGAPYALVENVVTHADHRRKGFGRAVIETAVEAGFAAGCYKVMLLTGARTPGTLEFYQDCGFTQTKTGFEMRRTAAGRTAG